MNNTHPKLVPQPYTNLLTERDVTRRPILETRHLGIDFGGLTAVSDFNIAIGATEIAGLIGPNGADEADKPEETPEPVEPAEPVLTPVVAQYASETIQSSAEATHIPENLAACTADADIPDDLEHIDSFIATAYYVTGTTSTGAYTTVGRTLAVNPNIIPYGTQVWMFLDDGTYIGTFTAEDTGSNMMAHPHVVDIYMGADSYNECILWGAQHVNLYTTPAENAAE